MMLLLARILLYLLHRLYLLCIRAGLFWKCRVWKPPAPLDANRKRIPQHLALLCSHNNPLGETKEDLIECVTRTVGWCRTVGIRKLTVYDEHGILLRCASRIEKLIEEDESDQDSSASDIEYPLTPPPSDYADSRPLTPASGFSPIATIEIPHRARKTRNQLNVRRSYTKNADKALTLCIISRDSGKPALAAAASSFLRVGNQEKRTRGQTWLPQITVDSLDTLLECDNTLSSPDFMIVLSINQSNIKMPLELHGYPPWHIRLTEIHHSHLQRSDLHSPTLLDEIAFREALDEYARAEFRFGK